MKLTKLAQKVRAGIATDADFEGVPLDEVKRIKTDADYVHYRTIARPVKAWRGVGGVSKAGKEEDVIRHVASDESADRMGDVILVNGWDLASFRMNPRLLAQHNHNANIGRVMRAARGKSSRTKGKALLTDSILYDAEEMTMPFAAAFRSLVIRGELNAVSVGFLPKDWAYPEDEKEREKYGLGRGGILFKKAELLELSVVAVPANPNALREKGTDKDFEAMCRQIIESGEVDERELDEFRKSCPMTLGDWEGRIDRRRSFVDFGVGKGLADLSDEGDEIEASEVLCERSADDAPGATGISVNEMAAALRTLGFDGPEGLGEAIAAEVRDLIAMHKADAASAPATTEQETDDMQPISLHFHLDGAGRSASDKDAEGALKAALTALSAATDRLKALAPEPHEEKPEPVTEAETKATDAAPPTKAGAASLAYAKLIAARQASASK